MIKTFLLSGMSCSACSSGIERAVSKLDGINSVNVSLIAKQMAVSFDEQKVSEQLIIATVEKLGYHIILPENDKGDKFDQAKLLKKRFISSIILLIPLVYLCLGHALRLPTPEKTLNFTLQFILALIILIINKKFFINGVKAIKNGSPNMDTLVSLGSASAFIYSVVMLLGLLLNKSQVEHVFFDSSAMVLSLVTLGKYLEEISKVRTGDAVQKLGSLMPKTSVIIKDGKEKTILTSQIEVGQKVLFRAGDYVAIDGNVIEGVASIDKSAITGESMPEEVSIGVEIISGTIVKNGYLIVEAKKVGGETLFNKIVEIVKTAGASKAPIQKFADKVASVFVPIVCGIALITLIVWLIISKELYSSFNYAISVLVISCPCSLGLATPVAVMAATGRSASCGVLFKNAEVLQNTCKINCVLLDKTATITVGKPKVTDFINLSDMDGKEIFKIVSALESRANHPLAESIVEYCGKSALSVDEFSNHLGKGVQGEVYGIKYYLGNIDILPNEIEFQFESSKYEGKTLIYFATDDQLLAVFALADCIKEDSKNAIQNLIDKNIKVVMITGDNQSSAKTIANQVGIEEFYANVLPQEKYQIVKKYQNAGYTVAMVGDGINDSPALKSANIGIAMGTGTDIAIDSSDIVLVNGSLSGLDKAINIGTKALKIIKQNLFWAFFYNCIGIPIAAGVLSSIGIVLSPIMASILMCCSSLFVVTNALRLSNKKDKNENKIDKEQKLVKVTLDIQGMMCNHCVSKIRNVLLKEQGVYDVDVQLQTNSATFNITESVDIQLILEQIKNVGFTAKIKE